MAKFEKIEELIGELNKHKKLFAALFDKRMFPIQEEMILPLVDHDTEKLERLAAYNLLVRGQSQVGLESRLQEFFEEFLEVDETVHVLYIQENLNQIKANQSYYLKENQAIKREQYLTKIKKHLRRIDQVTLQNVKTLRNNTDETYKTEINFDIKKEKLTDIRTQRDALEGVIKAVERMIQDDLFFKTATDAELQLIIHRLRLTLNDSVHNLIEVQQQIIEYLNHIEKRVQIVDKVLLLKSLRDKHYLKERTNFYQLAAQNADIPISQAESFRTRLAIESLGSDEERQKLIFKVRDKMNNRKLLAQNKAGAISDEAFESREQIEESFNLNSLKQIFLGKSQDLFSFTMQHRFNNEVSPQQRIQLYCRLASLFESEFTFSDQTGTYENLEYALIYPASVTTAGFAQPRRND
ncbi:hypothetical protein [Mangrovibacterium marinum]|uniref:Uncharacterized protein n=1 Tax=Mangrovibacterium marinum TaxID=1639118 RepID=A0A2T5C3I1_9BACT|nr:hypothetical protein [Mangrovibacterium marinum]PTN09289.1 hypothetical protein C8N47_105130 [Mangrovibacterium marinum]